MRRDHKLATGRPRGFARACHDAEGRSRRRRRRLGILSPKGDERTRRPTDDVRPPLRSRPVQNFETITSLVVVAARLLDTDTRGGVFTLEQLLKKMRELLKPGRTLATDDVRVVLPAMGHCLATAGGRWRWKRRERAYPG